MQDFRCKVLSIERVKERGRNSYLIIRLKKPEGFKFSAGQYVLLAHPGLRQEKNSAELLFRPYSVASSPYMEFLEFCIAVKYSGGLTEFLEKNLRVGGELVMRGPFGEIIPFREHEKIVFVVTGAGIAPAISVLRDLCLEGMSKPVQLFYGFPTCEHFLYRAELEKCSSDNKCFSVYAAANEEGGCCWRGVCGYIQPTLEEAGLRDEKAHYYLCGSSGSLKAMRVALRRMGIKKERIHFIAG